jgi:aminopeptidase N
MFRQHCIRFLLLGFLLSCTPAFAQYPRSLHHELKVSLEPAENRLSGVATIRVEPGRLEMIQFELSKTAQVLGVTVEGADRAFTFQRGRLNVPVLPEERNRVIEVAVEYSARFMDPVPEMPINMDNPGHGVTGIISEGGAFLLGGAAWHPQVPGSRPTYRLTVEAPEGILAVSAGRSLGHETRNGTTYSTWEVDFPLEGLALSAGPYRVRERTVNGISISTYFFDASQDLSDAYLDATARYLVFYENLFGPYPFAKFAVVENFFPTGYGFPSYTLLGSTVIRLPFIVETSLGHEIAHCWWGNGVLVDYRQGNWSEGLTTYVADYLYKENASAEEAREYRLQILRNFSTLVNEENDFPLARFQTRYDPASQAIGYGKGAMVFHMIRNMVGDSNFWEALREIYREKRFQKASWKDFQRLLNGKEGSIWKFSSISG